VTSGDLTSGRSTARPSSFRPRLGRTLIAALAVAATALVAAGAPGAAFGQGSTPTLREAPDSTFPTPVFTLALPQKIALSEGRLSVTENGTPVADLSVEAPGAASGAVLLIDASNSMAGAPIEGAMQAARAFIGQRNPKMPVAVVVFGPDDTVLAEFTTSQEELGAAIADAPPLAEGTHIYDALVRASKLVGDSDLDRSTVVLLSDGTDVGSDASREDALAALDEANVRVISVGLRSKQYNPEALKGIARSTGGTYAESASPAALESLFAQIGARISSEYTVRYTSLLPPEAKALVRAKVTGLPVATATYTTPTLTFTEHGTFERGFVDDVILSPYLMVFVIVSVVALLAFAILTAFDVRSRSIRRRMAQYVQVPTEEESNIRRAEVASMLTGRAQQRMAGMQWWQSFEKDVELAGFSASAVTIAGWTLVAGVISSLVVAVAIQSLLGLLTGLAAPFVLRIVVKTRVTRKRKAFGEQLPDNLDVLAGALRAGHSLVGAMNVMVDGADEPSKTEFRRVLSDEQLGVPIDQALMVTSRRMDNVDIEQVAIVTRLQREAGGNTAEVLDRVVENIRGRMEIRRLIVVLTAQGRLARWVLTGLPLVLVAFLMVINPDWLDPLTETNVGRAFLVLWALMLIAGSVVIKRIVEIEV
jgi:tight adherence protein B